MFYMVTHRILPSALRPTTRYCGVAKPYLEQPGAIDRTNTNYKVDRHDTTPSTKYLGTFGLREYFMEELKPYLLVNHTDRLLYF